MPKLMRTPASLSLFRLHLARLMRDGFCKSGKDSQSMTPASEYDSCFRATQDKACTALASLPFVRLRKAEQAAMMIFLYAVGRHRCYDHKQSSMTNDYQKMQSLMSTGQLAKWAESRAPTRT